METNETFRIRIQSEARKRCASMRQVRPAAKAQNLTPSMVRVLGELAEHPQFRIERYRSDWGTAKALKRRGLIEAVWIGMGAYQMALLPAGMAEIKARREGE